MEDKDGPLIEAIRTGQNINKNTYGYRRMTLWLNNFIGIHVNNKRVRRVMKKSGTSSGNKKKEKV
ncbi:IS3 family transposase [Cloacibacillus evryensis]|uniref:IS3 family transposase n=1 Tax=Cloacibacillus evryensis TaxID=508460 RepID=UPI0004AE64A6|nr:IS3 family transposase [Cloacibacillus evryensis]